MPQLLASWVAAPAGQRQRPPEAVGARQRGVQRLRVRQRVASVCGVERIAAAGEGEGRVFNTSK